MKISNNLLGISKKIIASFFILGLFIVSCNKDDYRDNLVGKYNCIVLYYDPINYTDTESLNLIIKVEKLSDNSLNVIIGDYFFLATNEGDNIYTGLESNGPPNYAKFYQGDSIFVYRRIGVAGVLGYYGKKITPTNIHYK